MVSALGVKEGEIKITDSLLEMGKKLLEGIYPQESINAILSRHYRLLDDLQLPKSAIDKEKNDFLAALQNIKQSAFDSKEEALDMTAGFG